MTQDGREVNEGEATSASRSAEVPTCKALSVHVTARPTSVQDTSFADLDEGAVGEVLTCLPSQASLAVATAVCKPWLGICKSPAFLSNFRRRHPGAGPLLGLLHFSCYLHDLRVTWDAGASSRPDLTITLRNMDKKVHALKWLQHHDLVLVDLNGSWCLLKGRDSNSILFVFDLLTGHSKELRWSPYRYIAYGYMTGFVIDGGNVIFTWKVQPGQVKTDDCYICPAQSDGRWRKVQPSCREADAARYAKCKHNVVWKQRAGEIIYSLCGPFTDGWCLAALDTRSMSYSIINLPRRLCRYRMLHRMTVMEMDNPGSLCLVHAFEEPRFLVRGWIWQGEGNAATAAGKDEWRRYRRVELQGLASKLAVELKSVEVVAACAGVVHLRLAAPAKEHQQDPTITTAAGMIRCYPENAGRAYYFASLDLRSGEFTNVQPESGSRCYDKVYPFYLPWRAPFLPPAGDNAEAGN